MFDLFVYFFWFIFAVFLMLFLFYYYYYYCCFFNLILFCSLKKICWSEFGSSGSANPT